MKKMVLTFAVIFAGLAAVFTCRYTFGKDDLQRTFIAGEKGESTSADSDEEDDDNDPDSAIVEMDESELGKKKKGVKYIKVDRDPESIGVLVNRKYPLSSSYVPSDLTVPNVDFTFDYMSDKRHMREIAAFYLERMFAAAERDGISLAGVSAYRSYQRQVAIYENNVRTRGKKATDAVSAKPGTSEHQTGLTIDISSASAGYAIDKTFGQSDAGKWVAANSWKYGFIVRYPRGKEKITGYEYEPWHIRFTGRRLARYLTRNNLTMEEYYADTEVKDKIHINKDIRKYKKQKAWAEAHPTPTPVPSAAVAPTEAPLRQTAHYVSPSPGNEKERKETLKPRKTPKPASESKGGENKEEKEREKKTAAPGTQLNQNPSESTGTGGESGNEGQISSTAAPGEETGETEEAPEGVTVQ